MNVFPPERNDQQTAELVKQPIQKFGTGRWRGDYEDISRVRGSLLLNLDTDNDTTLTGEFRLVNPWAHGETLYGGTLIGKLDTSGHISFVAEIEGYKFNFKGNWHVDSRGIQTMHGITEDPRGHLLLGGTWIVWYHGD